MIKKHTKGIFIILILLCTNCLSLYATSKDTLAIITFNDFHGFFIEDKDDSIPGASRLINSINEIKESYKNSIVLSGGDNFSGSYFSKVTDGVPQNKLFESIECKYSSVGNHEFDWGVKFLEDSAPKWYMKYLSANIYSDTINKIRPKWLKPHIIENIKLKNTNTDLRIAIIGLTTLETAIKTNPKNLKGVFFTSICKEAEAEINLLKDSADMFIFLTHIGTKIEENKLVFSSDTTAICLTELPVNAIISSHSHKKISELINGVPIIQADHYTKAIGLLNFEIDSLKNIKFLSSEIKTPSMKKNKEMEALLENMITDPEYGLNDFMCDNKTKLIHDRRGSDKSFTYLGALVTQAYEYIYRKHIPTKKKDIIIGISNHGGIRNNLNAGRVNRLMAGNILPFGGLLSAFKVTGKDLKTLFAHGFSGSGNGFLQSNNLIIEKEENNNIPTNIIYIDKKGKKINLGDDKDYTIIAESFLSAGGDKYDSTIFVNKLEDFEKIDTNLRNPTNAFFDYLKNIEEISEEKCSKCKLNLINKTDPNK